MYRRLMELPAWGLFDREGRLVASIRAEDAHVARTLFKAHGYSGYRVRKVAERGEQ